MEEATRFDCVESVPDTTWHHVRIAGMQCHSRLDANRVFVTVVKDQFHHAAHDVMELVTVRVDFAAMRSRFPPPWVSLRSCIH
jgi:hypothetical protein